MGVIGMIWKIKRQYTVEWGSYHASLAPELFRKLAEMHLKLFEEVTFDRENRTTTYYYLATEREARIVDTYMGNLETILDLRLRLT